MASACRFLEDTRMPFRIWPLCTRLLSRLDMSIHLTLALFMYVCRYIVHMYVQSVAEVSHMATGRRARGPIPHPQGPLDPQVCALRTCWQWQKWHLLARSSSDKGVLLVFIYPHPVTAVASQNICIIVKKC